MNWCAVGGMVVLVVGAFLSEIGLKGAGDQKQLRYTIFYSTLGICAAMVGL